MSTASATPPQRPLNPPSGPVPPDGPTPPRRPLGRGLTVFLAVDVVLVVVLVVLAAMALGDRRTPSAAPSGSVAAEQTPDETAPAQTGAPRELEAFALPSGNIWCEMSTEAASCTIASFSYERPKKPAGCAGQVGQVLRVSADATTSTPCVKGKVRRPADLPVLTYGQSSTIGDMTCSVSRRGAFCRHDPSQAGFSLARAGYRFF